MTVYSFCYAYAYFDANYIEPLSGICTWYFQAELENLFLIVMFMITTWLNEKAKSYSKIYICKWF